MQPNRRLRRKHRFSYDFAGGYPHLLNTGIGRTIRAVPSHMGVESTIASSALYFSVTSKQFTHHPLEIGLLIF